ncbi:DUF4091 domain-containing protein [Flavihumibacter petaseus]|uniref:Uncharacterized protein n=1 Tax=Flavihumibacter petaseus NBRC 106054 TaxID=1220578 RepID=A0A0E9N648_9BACT|nr:DUF4091 domain-containing protein [Flavihumibacter petaseus]GAO45181.1 hypothetical protein FPE01S_04_04250 [Flavihumibacter petaseus NBRC 106054]
MLNVRLSIGISKILLSAYCVLGAAYTYAQSQRVVVTGFTGTSSRVPQEVDAAGSEPVNALPSWEAKAWKGETIHNQVLLQGGTQQQQVSVTAGDLADGKGNRIPQQDLSIGWVKYVWTDEFRDGCGYRKSVDFDSSLVADRIQTGTNTMLIAAGKAQPVWVSVRVNANAVPGDYTGSIIVDNGKKITLPVKVTVLDRVLPPPSQWHYALDLWQHPAAIARVHQLPVWSEAHYKVMRPYYEMLARAGQKTITASITDEPWGHQTYDNYPSLIKWTKKKNGKWSFDYSLFDKYIAFVMDCGINQRINCYSMVPWKIAFRYHDEKLQRDTVFTGAIGTPAYNEFWSVMLRDFTRHLKKKNWFDRTAIAMDERPMEAMQSVIALLKTIDPAWKISLAGAWHPQIEKDITDYCIASEARFPDSVLIRRKAEGKNSTWYTCCSEKFPNGFTFSPPDEHVWMGWYTAATGMDGYLRWAFNSWTARPDEDSRFVTWPAGDTYQVYPGPNTSIRFEKMIEGIQDYEKIETLRKTYKATGDQVALNKLEAALNNIRISNFNQQSATEQLAPYRSLLND